MLGEDYRGQGILEITRVTHRMCRYEIKTLRTCGTCLGAQSIKQHSYDFRGGPVIKSPPCNAGDAGSIPGGATKIPQAAKPLSPRATTRESMCCNIRLHGLQTRLDVAKLKKKKKKVQLMPDPRSHSLHHVAISTINWSTMVQCFDLSQKNIFFTVSLDSKILNLLRTNKGIWYL